MDYETRKKFHEHSSDTSAEKSAKARELARLHALEDAEHGEKRQHSMDARKEYVESYEKHFAGLKEHQQPHWKQD